MDKTEKTETAKVFLEGYNTGKKDTARSILNALYPLADKNMRNLIEMIADAFEIEITDSRLYD